MAYFPYQPYPYQDQLNQLRNVNPMQSPMPMQFQPRQDANGLTWVQGEAGAKSCEYHEVGAKPAQEALQTENFVTVEEFNEFKTEVLAKLSEPVEVSLSRRKKGVNADE